MGGRSNEFPAIYDKEKVGESSLDNALSWDRIEPIRHRRYFDIPAILPELDAKHQARLKSDPDFIYLGEQLELLEASRATTSISLNEKTRMAKRTKDKAEALAIENKRRVSKGLEPLDTIDETGEELDETASSAEGDKTGEADSDVDEEIDPLLTETGHILLDALPIYKINRVANSR
ncbi:MAG TPA: hypothetical protein ENI05_15055 [Porticoccus sp.]|nr:hypothetical protein [Porticoccus sp.]